MPHLTPNPLSVRSRVRYRRLESRDTDTLLELLDLFNDLSVDPQQSISTIVNKALSVVGAECAIYARTNEESSRLILSVASNIPVSFPKSVKKGGRLFFDGALNGEKVPVAIEDLRATAYYKDPFVKRFRFRSYLGCPVRLKDDVVGSLCVVDTKNRLFGSFEMRSIAALARAIALEEERIRIQDALNKRVDCEKMLVEISRRAISIENVCQFLDWCLERMRKTLNVDGIFVWIYDSRSNTLNNISELMAKRIPPQRKKFHNVPAYDFPWFMKKLRRNRIINYRNIEEIPEEKERKVIKMAGVKSILVIPLFVRSTFYGAIGFEAYGQKRKWLDNDIYILRTVSQIMSRSIENLEFERALEKINSELECRVMSRTARLREATVELKAKQIELLDQREELEKLNTALFETNKALLVFTRNAKRDREDIKKNIGYSLREKIMPILDHLRSEELPSPVRAELDVMHMHLRDIIKGYPKGTKFSSVFTPVEARVAAMVKNGLRNQDIAKELGISVETVKSHRRNIRQKLKIRNEKINLRTFLECKWSELE